MQWNLAEEQIAYQEAFRDWLSGVAPTATVREWLDGDDASSFERRLVADGWAGVGLPEEAGGQGGGMVELALTAEELARTAVPSAAWLATVLAASALAGRRDLVEAALGGETIAVAVPAESVPESAPAVALGPAGRVTGTVPRVLAGDSARWFVVATDRTGEDSDGASAIGRSDGVDAELRLVEAAAPGVRITRRRLLDRSRSVADLTLEGAASVPVDADAAAVLRDISARAAVLVAADSLGATGRMLELAVDYCGQRHQFGVPIGSFQAVKHAAATILVGVEAARSVVYFAAASVDAGDPESAMHAAAAKAQVTAAGVESADSALTMHGAIGYTWEHDLHLFSKRVKLDEVLYGTPSMWNERIAQGLDMT